MKNARQPDKEAVRAASRLEDIMPALTGNAVSRNGGRELVTRCPFHADAHPSLRVNVDKHAWRCDPCKIGGDVFAFVQRYRSVDFRAMLYELAERAGLAHTGGPRMPEREHVYEDEPGVPLYKVVLRGRQPDVETKRGNPRYRWFRERHGATCWELDALSPVVLRNRVEQAILDRLDQAAWDRAAITERGECESLDTILQEWPGISSQESRYSPSASGRG